MRRFLILAVVFSFFIFAPQAEAAKWAPFEMSGWIPYWRAAAGTEQALLHKSRFAEVNPFVYTVKSDGTIHDAGGMEREPWLSFVATIKQTNIRLIPTIMWSNGAQTHAILSDKNSRDAHIANIVALVNKHGYDGIDIDYEAKLAATNPHFSAFLRDLYKALGTKKWLMCTVEPRTPLDSLNTNSTTTAYANDYSALNKYCDRVRIMAYDQASVDRKLTLSTDQPYIPVADVRWVEKVMREAMKSINKNKLMLGIPTYGYEYEVIPLTHGYRYNKLWAFNPRYATGLATELGITPQRNIAGELSFIYRPKASTTEPVATIAATSNVAIAKFAFSGASYHIVWWSDAFAIKDKVDLAKRLGLRGVAIFKIDGSGDPIMWNVLP